MNLPYGLPNAKDADGKEKYENLEASILYERKLAEYRDTLENYKKCITEYSGKLENYDKRTLDNQLSIVQTALDLTYLREQIDKSIELLDEIKKGPISHMVIHLEGLIKAVVDTSYKIDGLDTNVVNRLSELIIELQKQTIYQNKQLQTELANSIEQLNLKVKKSNSLLWFVIGFNILGLSALAFLVLYIMEIIPF